MKALSLLDLGRRDYLEAWRLQKELVKRRLSGEIGDTLILVEHPPVVTLGRHSKQSPPKLPIPVYRVERGGEATYHGPGQLVGYPIIHLAEWELSLKQYVWSLEEAIIRLLGEYGLEGRRREGHPGVWVQGLKVASIGLALERWVTYHGFALNVNTDLHYFRVIEPCGLEGAIITSLHHLLDRPITLGEVKPRLLHHFQEVFACRLTGPPEAP
jgi:lipoate-protein ligase B